MHIHTIPDKTTAKVIMNANAFATLVLNGYGYNSNKVNAGVQLKLHEYLHEVEALHFLHFTIFSL